MNTLSYTQDKIEAYWLDKPIKSWVVKLESGRREKFDSETKAGSRYFCESLFWASQPKQAAKT